MSEENQAEVPVEVAAPVAEAPMPKKQRAPRRSKAEIAAEATAKSLKVRRTRIAKGTNASVKSPVKAKVIGNAGSLTVTSVVTGDDLGDLLKLEEENKMLRATLAEKLRVENADLRKRLGY